MYALHESRSSHDHVDVSFDVVLFSRPMEPSTPGLRATAVILHVALQTFPACCSHPAVHEHATRRFDQGRCFMTGFVAPSISDRFAGTTLALNDIREPNQNQQFGNTSKKAQPARRNGTCSAALRPRFCARLLSQSSPAWEATCEAPRSGHVGGEWN